MPLDLPSASGSEDEAEVVRRLLGAYAPLADTVEEADQRARGIDDGTLFELAKEVAEAERRGHLRLSPDELYETLGRPNRKTRELLSEHGFSDELIYRLGDVGAKLREASATSPDFAKPAPKDMHRRSARWRGLILALALSGGAVAGAVETTTPQSAAVETVKGVSESLAVASSLLTLTDPELLPKIGKPRDPDDQRIVFVFDAARAAEHVEARALGSEPTSAVPPSTWTEQDWQNLTVEYHIGGRERVAQTLLNTRYEPYENSAVDADAMVQALLQSDAPESSGG